VKRYFNTPLGIMIAIENPSRLQPTWHLLIYQLTHFYSVYRVEVMQEVSWGLGCFFWGWGVVLVEAPLPALTRGLPPHAKGLAVTLFRRMNCINPCPSPLYSLPTGNNNRITKIPHSLMGW